MRKENINVSSSVNLIAGILLMILSYDMGFTGMAMSNVFYVGLLVALFSLVRFFATGGAGGFLDWASTILGAWLIVSPAFIAGMGMAAIWTSIIFGIIVFATGLTVAMSSTMGRGHPKAG